VLHEVFPALILATLAYVGISLSSSDGADERVIALMDGPVNASDASRGTVAADA
jgi:hypothetical protein